MSSRVPAELPVVTGTAADFVPQRRTLKTLREASLGCRGCHLWMVGSQTVFGEGKAPAKIMLVGEQPGDAEDREGHPFVGPAGRLLDEALAEAGIERSDVYITNAVKHFSWEPRGKRRIHKKPRASEIRACRPWLEAELEAVRPSVIVCLGATAFQSLMGSGFKLTAHRGTILESPWAGAVVATIHPSAVLRAPDSESRRVAFEGLVADLSVAARALRK